MRIHAVLLVLLSILAFTGCRTVMVVPANSHSTVTHSTIIVPPSAPANGYRLYYHGLEMVYDSDFGAYAVVDFDGIFYYNNFYFRFYNSGWQLAERHNGTWRHADDRRIPQRLRNHKRFKRYIKHAPPPHAPAHGYRLHHQQGVDLVFDSGIGAYIVLGFDDLFFFDNHYMRFYDGYWYFSDRYDGRWRRAVSEPVPHRLRQARKKGLLKKLKHQYRKEHRESREYREKHGHRDKNEHREYRRDQQQHDYREGYRDDDKNSSRKWKENKELFKKLKKEQEKKGKRNKDDRDKSNEKDEEESENNDRRDRRGNGYRE